MDSKLIAWAGKVFLKNKKAPFSLEDWSKLWSKTLDQSKLASKDPDTLAFLRGILGEKTADTAWLDGHLPWTAAWPQPQIWEGTRQLGTDKLDDDILSELDTKLLEVGDGKIHRRFLRSVRAAYLGTPRPLLLATLLRVANHYPLTQRALDYLTAWEKNPQTLEEDTRQRELPKPRKRELWPWKPILLGFFMAALVLAFIYLTIRSNLSSMPVDPLPSPPAGLPQPERPVDLPSRPAAAPETPSPEKPEEQVSVDPDPEVPNPEQTRSYVVQAGDSLSIIAQRYMFNLQAWPEIYNLNKGLVGDPDFILPGWRLRIPER